jgi:hypothetical protein
MFAYNDRKGFARQLLERDPQALQRVVNAALIYCSVREDRTWRSTELDETLREAGLYYVAQHFSLEYLRELQKAYAADTSDGLNVLGLTFNRSQLPAFIKYLKEEYYGCTQTTS